MIETIGYISILFPWALGMVILWYLTKPIKITSAMRELGFDESNRVTRLWLLWIVITRPWRFVVVLRFLKYDLAELAAMINDVESKK